MKGIPYVALLIGLTVQTLVSMGAYSVPAAAPAIAADLDIAGERVGFFISAVYGIGMVSAVLSVSFIRRYGAVRVSQFVLLSGIAMIVAAAFARSVAGFGIAALLLGLGYGATAPTSSHLLMKRTPSAIRNVVFSIRQIGVPLGGVLGGLIVPPLVLAFDWQTAIGVQLVPALLMLVLLQGVRTRYDADRDPAHVIRSAGLLGPLRLLATMREIPVLALTTFFYAGMQLCFVAYLSVHLTSQAGFGLIAAGQVFATYQLAGVVSRPIWGVIADRWIPARLMLATMGFVMAAMAVLAGTFSAAWPPPTIFAVAALAGMTASGYTGLAFAEYARIGGIEHVADATALGASTQFFGVMVLPALFSVLVSSAGYGIAYNVMAVLAALSALGLLVFAGRAGGQAQHVEPQP